jgi:hypothetical protein
VNHTAQGLSGALQAMDCIGKFERFVEVKIFGVWQSDSIRRIGTLKMLVIARHPCYYVFR